MPRKRQSVTEIPTSFQEQDAVQEVADAVFKPELKTDVADPISTVEVVPPPAVDEAEPIELDDVDEGADITASTTVGKNTVGGTLLRVGKFYNEAGELSVALTGHLRATAAEPELHSFLQRIQLLLGEFRHQFEQYEGNISEQLRDAIQQALT